MNCKIIDGKQICRGNNKYIALGIMIAIVVVATLMIYSYQGDCGGIAGLDCPGGYICILDHPDVADSVGKCAPNQGIDMGIGSCSSLIIDIRPATLGGDIPVGANFCLYSNKNVQSDLFIVLKNGNSLHYSDYLFADQCAFKQFQNLDCNNINEIKLIPKGCTEKEVSVATNQIVCGTPII